jgi:hypothetical protein
MNSAEGLFRADLSGHDKIGCAVRRVKHTSAAERHIGKCNPVSRRPAHETGQSSFTVAGLQVRLMRFGGGVDREAPTSLLELPDVS